MSDSDDDLNRAIALSLQQHSPTTLKQNAAVIDLISSDDEDDDLDAPVSTRKVSSFNHATQRKNAEDNVVIPHSLEKPNDATGKGEERPERTLHSSNLNPATTQERSSDPELPSTRSTLLGLDRKQMESERLLRANQKKDVPHLIGGNESRKRKVPMSPTGQVEKDGRLVKTKYSNSPRVQENQVKSNEVTQVNSGHISNNRREGSAPVPLANNFLHRECINGKDSSNSSNEQSTAPEVMSYGCQQRALQDCGVQFPNGVVKRTWAYGYPREDDIKIEEVFQKKDLELAVLSAFQVDPDWVSSKLDKKTRVIWVLQAKDESEKERHRSGAPNNYRFCYPSMEGNINCMHSKLQLLAHRTHLRIVVPSANLVPYDWGESGVMENVCFLIDLPRLPEGKVTDPSQLTHFGKELLHFVTAMGLDEITISSMNKFDFSRTGHLGFVHSIGGSHSGVDWKRTGYCGLGTAVRNLGLDTKQALSVDFVAASIGNLNDSFVKSIYLAAQGDDGWTEYRWRTDKPSRGKSETEAGEERRLVDGLKDRFRVYFPTRDTVAQSKGGIGAGGTICFQSQWYDSDGFPRHLMRDCTARRRGILMHSKMMFVQPETPHQLGRAWAYVGSANLSESAWGRLVKDRATKEPKLNCRNWECGIIFPVADGVAGSGGQLGPMMEGSGGDRRCLGDTGLEVFRGYVPVPMEVPGEKYGMRRPWFYRE